MSKINLYSRLFKYRETPNQSPLENYCTEILCDFLNRLTYNENLDFIKVALFANSEDTFSNWNNCLELINQDFEWRTQVSCNDRRFDLVCYQSEKPVILIEVKVNSPVDVKQLKRYGRWLQENNPNAILCLLTNLTQRESEPPDDFYTSASYGVKFRSNTYWHNIYSWTKKLVEVSQHQLEEHPLANDLISFLGENRMAFENPRASDISALRQLMCGDHVGRINAFMKNLRTSLKENHKQLSWRVEEQDLGADKYWLIDYITMSWVIIPNYNYTWFGWGIYFPGKEDNTFNNYNQYPRGSFSIECLPKEPCLYFLVSSKNNDVWNRLNDIKSKPETTKIPNICWSNNVKPIRGADDETIFIAYLPLDMNMDLDFTKSLKWLNDWFDKSLKWLNN